MNPTQKQSELLGSFATIGGPGREPTRQVKDGNNAHDQLEFI